MPGKYSWKEVAKTAKKWADSKITETTTADRRTREHAEARQNELEREIEAQAGGAALTTLFPGLGRTIERQEENRARSEREHRERARARRQATVVRGSTVEVRGYVNGLVAELAVQVSADDQARTLTVVLETVDPVPLDRAELSAGGFGIADFHGDGTYTLGDENQWLQPGCNHVVFDGGDRETDWFYWTSDYGPATAVVGGGAIEVTMPCRNAASDELTVTVRVPMP